MVPIHVSGQVAAMFESRLYCDIIATQNTDAFETYVALVRQRGEINEVSTPAQHVQFVSWYEPLTVIIKDHLWITETSAITTRILREIVTVGSVGDFRLVGVVTPFEAVTEGLTEHIRRRLSLSEDRRTALTLSFSKLLENWSKFEPSLRSIEFVQPNGLRICGYRTGTSLPPPPGNADICSISIDLDPLQVTVEKDFSLTIDDVTIDGTTRGAREIANHLLQVHSIFSDYLDFRDEASTDC
jgi:hypothetical protein